VFARQTILFRGTSEADGDSIWTHGGPPEEHIEDNRIPKGLSSLLIPPRNRCGGHGFRGGSFWFDVLHGHGQEDVDFGTGAGLDVITGACGPSTPTVGLYDFADEGKAQAGTGRAELGSPGIV
jgi:hypothetical protein